VINETSQGTALLTIQESAEYLGVHKNTVRNLIMRKQLRAKRIGARIVRVNQSDLDALFSTYESGEFGCWRTNN
jgi:excisionase family DNA binding protein